MMEFFVLVLLLQWVTDDYSVVWGFFFKMIIVTCLIYPEYCSVKLVDGFGSLE